MILQRPLLVPLLLALVLSVACRAEPPLPSGEEEIAEIADGVTVADRAFVRAVEVTDDALSLPRRGHDDAVRALEPGDVLVGDRSTAKGSTNPYGFARRVKSIRTEGDRYVIETDRVGFADLFRRAKFRLKIDDPSPRAGAARPRTVDGASGDGDDPPRLSKYGIGGLSWGYDTKVKTVGDRTADVKIAVSDAFAYVDPSGASISLEKEDVRVKKLVADLPFKYDAGMSACGELSAHETIDGAIKDQKLSKTLLDKNLFTVTVLVGGVPVVATLHAKVDAWCKVDISGKATVAGRFRTTGAPALHVGWDDGWTSHFDQGDPKNFGSLDAEAAASAALTCGANGKLGVYLYDTVGVYATLNPSVTLKASGGAGTAGEIADRTSMCLGLDGHIDTQVGVEAKVLSKTLFDRHTTPWQTSFEIMNVCATRDSCAGRPAGWYCSDLEPYSAFECDGTTETIVRGGIPCDSSELCKRTGPSRTDPAEMEPAESPDIPPKPVCVTEQAAEDLPRALSCPMGQVPIEQHVSSACERGDGYSCDADPVTGRDRACCGGQCVVWGESACDETCRCYGTVAGVDAGEKKCGETVCGQDNVLWRCEGTMTEDSPFFAQTSYVSTFESCQ